jgi:hypothetical protein
MVLLSCFYGVFIISTFIWDNSGKLIIAREESIQIGDLYHSLNTIFPWNIPGCVSIVMIPMPC